MAEKSITKRERERERERGNFIIQGQNQIHKTKLLFIEPKNT